MTGSHLAEVLLSDSAVKVHGTIYPQTCMDFIAHIESRLVLHECDLQDPEAVDRMIKEIRPDHIYHLAAKTSVANSWENPDQTISNNITCQLNLFEAVRKNDIQARILVTGSSEAYGLVSEKDLPVDEDTGFRPLSPYGVSKVAQDALAYQYYKSYGMDIVRVRVFNLTGPRQIETFALSSFAKQLAMIAAGEKEPVLMVGNLQARRDFSDFRDAARAYCMALEKGGAGQVYNIGSGISQRLDDSLAALVEIAGVKVDIRQNPDRMRPSDIPHMVCDNTRFVSLTGWKPQIKFSRSLEDLFNYWKMEIGRKQ